MVDEEQVLKDHALGRSTFPNGWKQAGVMNTQNGAVAIGDPDIQGLFAQHFIVIVVVVIVGSISIIVIVSRGSFLTTT